MLANYIAAWAFAYIGMLALCQGLERHYKQVWNKPPSAVLRRALRGAGWLSLAVSFYFLRHGLGLGNGSHWLVWFNLAQWLCVADVVAVPRTAGGVVTARVRPAVGGDRNVKPLPLVCLGIFDR